jgi:AraC family transcriptional regulator
MHLAGKRITTSFAENRTAALWRSVMPQLLTLPGRQGTDLFSVEIYPEGFFNAFRPDVPFEKWAAVAVAPGFPSPEGFEALDIPGGLYAVFIHKGPASESPRTYNYIFGTWLPASSYTLDSRPHFARMGGKYRNDHPDSEEEIWVPVSAKPSASAPAV